MSRKIFSIPLFKRINELVRTGYSSISEFARRLTTIRLKQQADVDDFGVKGGWKTVVSFEDIEPAGVPASEVLKAIDKLAR